MNKTILACKIAFLASGVYFVLGVAKVFVAGLSFVG